MHVVCAAEIDFEGNKGSGQDIGQNNRPTEVAPPI